MSPRSLRPLTPLLAAGCLSTIIAVGCNHNGKGFDLDGSACVGATFVADETNPAALSVSMAAGAESGVAFEVDVLVTGIDRFFGAAFRIMFDAEVLRYDGFRSDGSFILETGVSTDFRAQLDPHDPGTLVVNATRLGPVAGVDVPDSELLMTFDFSIKHPGSVSKIEFGNETSRQVTTCPEPPEACTIIPAAKLNWPGGSVVGN